MNIYLDAINIGLIISAVIFGICVIVFFIIIMINRSKYKKIKKEDSTSEDYTDLVLELIEFSGGKDNIIEVNAKMTRLIITIKDESLLRAEGLALKYMVNDNKFTVLIGENAEKIKEKMKEIL